MKYSTGAGCSEKYTTVKNKIAVVLSSVFRSHRYMPALADCNVQWDVSIRSQMMEGGA